MLHTLKDNVQRIQYAVSADSQSRRQKLLPQNRPFTVVANDCWGAEVYKDFGLPFDTPFIGLFVPGSCFMKLVSDFKQIVTSPIRFTKESRFERDPDFIDKGYPIGILADDIELHFLHYDSEADAASKWSRRVERIVFDRLFFKISADGKYPFTDEEVRRFGELPIPRKLVLTRRSFPDVACAVSVPADDYLENGKLMYERTHKYVDMATWLNQP
jgi:uncharacterized protein (DUF1919 family)